MQCGRYLRHVIALLRVGGRCVKYNKKSDDKIFKILFQSFAPIFDAILHA